MNTRIIIASGPVIVENGKVLLDQHGDTDFWKFCGGRADNLEEDLITIAKRRAKEELGIEIEIDEPFPYLMHTQKETPEGILDVILVHYLAQRIGEVKPGAEIREWAWLDINTLPDNLAPNIIPTLKHFGFIQ
jgi:8-oxo-dGTP pyrophosphatase MutT (NUDIX family)